MGIERSCTKFEDATTAVCLIHNSGRCGVYIKYGSIQWQCVGVPLAFKHQTSIIPPSHYPTNFKPNISRASLVPANPVRFTVFSSLTHYTQDEAQSTSSIQLQAAHSTALGCLFPPLHSKIKLVYLQKHTRGDRKCYFTTISFSKDPNLFPELQQDTSFSLPSTHPLLHLKHHPTTNAERNIGVCKSVGEEIPVQLPGVWVGSRQPHVECTESRREDGVPGRRRGMDGANKEAVSDGGVVPREVRQQGE